MSIATLVLALPLALPTPALPALAVPTGASVQDDPNPDAVQRLESWPELEGDEERGVRREIDRLRKARTPEMASEAREALSSGSAGAAPLLLGALAKEKGDEGRERIEAVLTALTGAPHTRLLAKEFDGKSERVRVFAMERCALFPDPGIRASAEAALARVQKAGKKADPAERRAAALCATSSGSTAGLELVAELARTSWSENSDAIRHALEAVRGKEATELVAPMIASGDRAQLVTGLHLLAGCGDRTAVALVRPQLDSSDNSVRVAAINAMRGIVDGDPPLNKLPVFEAIELAKQWKTRG